MEKYLVCLVSDELTLSCLHVLLKRCKFVERLETIRHPRWRLEMA